MKHVMLCLLLVLPAGCAANRSSEGPRGYCEQQARNDPEVVRLNMESLGHNADVGLEGRARLAQRRALERCLRQQGLPAPGGVEAVVPQ